MNRTIILISCAILVLACGTMPAVNMESRINTLPPKPLASAEPTETSALLRYSVCVATLNIRTGPGSSFPVVDINGLDYGTIVTRTATPPAKSSGGIADWYEVTVGNLTGWVFSGALCPME